MGTNYQIGSWKQMEFLISKREIKGHILEFPQREFSTGNHKKEIICNDLRGSRWSADKDAAHFAPESLSDSPHQGSFMSAFSLWILHTVLHLIIIYIFIIKISLKSIQSLNKYVLCGKIHSRWAKRSQRNDFSFKRLQFHWKKERNEESKKRLSKIL